MKKILFLAVLSLGFLTAHAQIKVSSNGSVGIGGIDPVYKLDISSSSFRSSRPSSSNSPLIINHFGADPRICSDSKIVFYSSANTGFIDIQCKTLYENSDSTAKKNIVPLSAVDKSGVAISNIEKIKKLKGVNYSWKSDNTSKKQAGFLAQEVESVIPEAVITNDSTQNKSLAYSAIIPYLVEAIKEQQVEIETLKQQLGK